MESFVNKVRSLIGLPPTNAIVPARARTEVAPVTNLSEVEELFAVAMEVAAQPHATTVPPEVMAEGAFRAAGYVATACNPEGGAALWAALGLVHVAGGIGEALAILRLLAAREAMGGHPVLAIAPALLARQRPPDAPRRATSALRQQRPVAVQTRLQGHDAGHGRRVYERGHRRFTSIDGGGGGSSA
jgi:hypothetical protein